MLWPIVQRPRKEIMSLTAYFNNSAVSAACILLMKSIITVFLLDLFSPLNAVTAILEVY